MGLKMITVGRQALVGTLFQILLFSSNCLAADTPPPTSVTIAGNFQSELGCSGDWQPDCAATDLAFDAGDQVWQETFAMPAGSWEYKAALNNSWDENYGLNATRNGANLGLSLSESSMVKFYYSHETHWITSNRNSVIAVAVGNFQSELGCPGDWQPDCLRSWLQDPDGDGIYTFTTQGLPAGSYEVKVAINESWDENYGDGGVQNGANIPFTVPQSCAEIHFSYNAITHVLSVLVGAVPPETCGDPSTPIYAVQGSGAASPLVGMEVAIEGVVVGDFQNNVFPDNGDLNGFYVQDPVGDGDSTTSDGIFVYAPGGIDVSVGDAVRVRGFVSEFNGMTEITASQIWVCSSGDTVTPTPLSLPVTTVDDFEAFEGMLVTFQQALYISEYFNFDRFGEIVLTSKRHLAPTAEFEPGPDALQAAQEFLLDRITLDDGRSTQNPDPAIHPNGNTFDLTNLFRGGDTVQNVTGVIDYSFGLYRIQPIQGADYAETNSRTPIPDDVGGTLKVASLNVFNYFTTIDTGAWICGPDGNQQCRGADDPDELTRQRDKIIAALVAMDADVVGLIEIENHPGDVPTADLVSGLNAAMGAGTYEYIATGAIGTDAIRQALIYKPASVTPEGSYAILDDTVDPRFLADYNRPVLAQTFMDNSTGGVFTVAVNHLKSKGSDCNAIGDPDFGDGAGNCNLTRKAAAEALVDWLATDPTSSADEDFLIIGDLNSYDKEDPIDAIKAGPDDTPGTADDYTDMVFALQGEDAYSYVFDGQLGYLDHALASAGLAPQITGVTIWHINADEPDLIDYDMTFKQPAQVAIYAPDAYRSSDHDPVIIGLGVCDEIAPTFEEVSVTPDTLWPANHKYVDVTATVVASDNFDADPAVYLVSVTSNEPDNGYGDGNTTNDIVIFDDFHFKLRAERSGTGAGRIYAITYMATDSCGNSTTATVSVTVPLSRGR